ncbi:MAG: adenylate/guanylate cyclase domain-containing protein [Pseudomonadota bacterium]
MDRRLSAIMVADVVGYSRLMSSDESATLSRLKRFKRAVFDPAVAAGCGRIVKLMGDGALVEFKSVTDAICAALAIQESADRVGETGDDVAPIRLRIGVHVGDVLVQGHDIYGNGVNVASRLESIAPPGGVVVSAAALEHVTTDLDLLIEDLGAIELKNIDRPIRACSLSRAPGASARANQDPALFNIVTPNRRPFIAVLPFTNLSEDKTQDYFADGLSEDLIDALSRWRSFAVIARNSSFALRGGDIDMRAAGAALQARYILAGSVRAKGERIRVSARLTDAEENRQVWSEQFDRRLDDLFAIQDDISRRIAAIAAPELEHAEHIKARQHRRRLTAWDCYVRGMHGFNLETCEGYAAARSEFEKAVSQDPNFTDAWARLAWTHLRAMVEGCTDDRSTAIETSLRLVRRALEIDDSSAVARLCLGTAYVWSDMLDEGLAEAQRALQLNPSYAHAAMAVGNRLDLVGRSIEGIEHMRAGLELNPRDPQHRWTYMLYLSRAHLSVDRLEAALDWVREAVSLRPDHPDVHFRHALCLAHLDRVPEARGALRRSEKCQSGFLRTRREWHPYRDEARNEQIFAGLCRHALWPAEDGV